MAAKPIFIGGTGSHVGKSWVATAICRYLYRAGHRVAPFKSQNMSNNSMACAEGGEIGRAQAAQAEACGLAPHPDMNPILLKPTGELGSQVVLHGRAWRNLKAAEYYEHFDFLLDEVLTSYRRLADGYDYIVIEGAGSVTELNLKHRDLVNLGLASRIDAPGILVADVDRGGVFASVVGTFHLLEPEESSLVRSFVVNRFRGDVSLFSEGVRILEEKTGRPCLGVFPYAPDIHLDPEDSVSLPQPAGPQASATTHPIAIVRFPYISNFTDFRLLKHATYIEHPIDKHFEVIFLPGTKNTIDDLLWLRTVGLEDWLLQQVQEGARVIGVCGGFQMLGESIEDPAHAESLVSSVRGIGLLPVRTRLAREKSTRTVQARTPSGIPFQAYEIHLGVTEITAPGQPFALLENGPPDGIRYPGVVGTYLHGAFENQEVLEESIGFKLAGVVSSKESHYDRLADWFAENANMNVFLERYLND